MEIPFTVALIPIVVITLLIIHRFLMASVRNGEHAAAVAKTKSAFKKMKHPIWVQLILLLVRFWLVIYDILAFVPFMIFANPKRKLAESAKIKAKPLKEGDPGSPYRNADHFDELLTVQFEGATTIDRLWDRSTMFFANCPCMGTRQILSVEQEKQKNGRIFEKYEMGDYKWQTYSDVGDRVESIGSGLLKHGHEARQHLVIFSDTRAEWMMIALTAFKYGFPVVTVYPTLGEDAIAHAIKETNAETIVASQELVHKVVNVLAHTNLIKRLVYIESRTPGTPPLKVGDLKAFPSHTKLLSLKELEEHGAKHHSTPKVQPEPDDVAVVMYTSGTTGMPKGVVMTHGNLIAACAGVADKLPKFGLGDSYIGYLPLAHVLELVAELTAYSNGACVGYSSALTMTDTSSKVKQGGKGDCSLLRPTFMATVPTIMDRIYKAVLEKVEHSSALQKGFFEFLYELKRSKIEDGFDTPFLNRLVFSHIRAILGGRIRIMMSGGAPLNAETQRFMNICFCCPVEQGYGLTETCGGGTVCDHTDLRTGRVGGPIGCCDILLRDWEEAGYSVKNKPHPQGEILISGANVTKGYLNNKKKTDEDFIMLDGRRWFCTGDVGEFQEDGCLRIIDRKKDLLKLQHGEYISVTKVETVLSTNSIVDNIWVYGSSDQNFLIAFIVPNRKQLQSFADKHGISESSFEKLCANKKLAEAVQKELEHQGKSNRLEKAEMPQKVHLCEDVWSSESGLLTDALKLKRRPLEEKYKKQIQELYGNKNEDE